MVHKSCSKKHISVNILAMISVSCLACWPVQNNVLCQLFIRAHALNRLAIKIISSNNISSTAQNLSYSSTILTIFRNNHLEFFDICYLCGFTAYWHTWWKCGSGVELWEYAMIWSTWTSVRGGGGITEIHSGKSV